MASGLDYSKFDNIQLSSDEEVEPEENEVETTEQEEQEEEVQVGKFFWIFFFENQEVLYFWCTIKVLREKSIVLKC